MKRILQRRQKAIAKLLDLAEQMLLGSISETYRTCGTPGCRCHSSGPKHGPHMYVIYKGEHGRSTGYYVQKSLQADVREGIVAWKEFHKLAKEVAHLNRQINNAKRSK